jgi:PST family polysaccharide transporter
LTLIKTLVLNGVATFVKLATLLALNKIIAVYVGPAGYALIGQFSNIVSIVGAIFGGGFVAAGVTKYTAENNGNEERQKEIWHSASAIVFFTSLPISMLILWYHQELALILLGDSKFGSSLVFLALSLPLMGLNSLLLSIVNGKKEFRKFVSQNIYASIFGALISGGLIAAYGLIGALAAISLNQSLVLLITIWIFKDAEWLKIKNLIGIINKNRIKSLLTYTLIPLSGAIIAPLGQYIIRHNLIEKFGVISAGDWQAVFKISEIYLMLFTATLSVYYLPRLSEIRDIDEIKKEIIKVYKFILPMTVLTAFIIYQLRELVVIILFTKEFSGMSDLFFWQLIGDVLKIGSWIISFIMVAKGMVRWFILSELFFTSTWIIFTLIFTWLLGIKGATVAFAFNYGVYWICMFFLMKNKLNNNLHWKYHEE